VTVAKTAVGGDGSFPFTLTGVPAHTITTSNGSGVTAWNDLVPGDYTLAEAVPAGWDMTSMRCTNGSDALATRSVADGVAFTVAPGAAVLCTVTDTARATVNVVKQADGGDGTFTFSLTGRDDVSITTEHGTGRASWTDVVPGTVDLTETVPAGWDLGTVACADADGPLPTDAIADGVHFTVAPGAAVTCTFSDTARGSVTVVKQTVGGDGDFPFSLTGQPGAVVTTAGNTGSHAWANVVPGVYTLAETVPAGWDLDHVACTSGGRDLSTTTDGSAVTFTLAPGTDVTCTFVDVARGAVTVVNHTDPPTADAFDFRHDGAPFTLAGGATTTFGDERPGLHTVATTVPAGWALRSIDCDGGTLATSTDGVTLDLAPGRHVTCTFDLVQLATFTVVKHAVGGDGDFSFALTGAGDRTVTTANGSGTTEWGSLEPGSYTVSETPASGWETTAVECDQPALTNGPSATLELAPGSHVTCTFTNERHGSVTVVKQTAGGDGTFPFTLAGRDARDLTTVDGTGSTTWTDVAAGQMSLAEVVPDGWRLDGATCATADGALPTDATNAGVTFTLAPGAGVVCTFTDTKLGDVTVVKHTVGGDATFDFALTDHGTTTVSTVGGEGTAAWDGVEPGSYELTETIPTDWDLGSVVCTSNGDALATNPLDTGVGFAVAAGAHVVCTFTDTARGSIRVIQHTDPEMSDDFALTFDGTPFTLAGDGGTQAFAHLRARTYDIAEQLPDGWQLASVDCGDQPVVRNGTTISVELAPGASLVCTFTAAQDAGASIGLTEFVDGSPAHRGDTVFYVFTITNTGQSPLTNVALSDDLLGTVPLDVTDLAPGDSVEAVVPYNVPDDAPVGQAILDTSTATGTPPVGSDVTATAHGSLDVQDTVIGDT
jgi:hypothetical protein